MLRVPSVEYSILTLASECLFASTIQVWILQRPRGKFRGREKKTWLERNRINDQPNEKVEEQLESFLVPTLFENASKFHNPQGFFYVKYKKKKSICVEDIHALQNVWKLFYKNNFYIVKNNFLITQSKSFFSIQK